MKRWLLILVWVFFAALSALLSAGCMSSGPHVCVGSSACEDVLSTSDEGDDARSSDVEHGDAPIVEAVSTTIDVSSAAGLSVDAGVVVATDASVNPDAMSIGSRFEARVLAPSTCHGRTLRLPDEFYQRGMTPWHFCYVTPDPRLRSDAGPSVVRPTAVSFHLERGVGFALETMVSVPAPRTANPWTASVAVALPDTITVPRFNVQQILPSEYSGILWALDNDDRGGLRQLGHLRAWRVGPNGEQTEVPLDMQFSICGGTMGPTGFPAGDYVPEGLCPDVLRRCPPHLYHCRR